jgi:hypothetical protein
VGCGRGGSYPGQHVVLDCLLKWADGRNVRDVHHHLHHLVSKRGTRRVWKTLASKLLTRPTTTPQARQMKNITLGGDHDFQLSFHDPNINSLRKECYSKILQSTGSQSSSTRSACLAPTVVLYHEAGSTIWTYC